MSFSKVIVNVQTREEQVIPLTAEEISELQESAARDVERFAAEEAARAAAEAARESGRAKLAALGLTEAEVAALVK